MVVVLVLLLLVVAAVELPFENHRALKDLRSEEPDESEDDALTRMRYASTGWGNQELIKISTATIFI